MLWGKKEGSQTSRINKQTIEDTYTEKKTEGLINIMYRSRQLEHLPHPPPRVTGFFIEQAY